MSPDTVWEGAESSDAILLAEHDRLSALYLFNAEMGEKRASFYLALISAGAALLLGLAQLQVDITELQWPFVGFLVGVLLVGILTYKRLLERRIRSIEYLRATNRIHRYFTDKCPELAPYFYWPACDDRPGFEDRSAVHLGLREVIAVVNSLFVGLLVGIICRTLWPLVFYPVAITVGFVAVVLAWSAHRINESHCLALAEAEAAGTIRFPLNPPCQ